MRTLQDDERIRVYLVDDHPMIRLGLSALVEGENDFVLVGQAESGEAALAGIPLALPDVVLMDLVMPGMDGIAAIASLKPRLPATRFVILSATPDDAEPAAREVPEPLLELRRGLDLDLHDLGAQLGPCKL